MKEENFTRVKPWNGHKYLVINIGKYGLKIEKPYELNTVSTRIANILVVKELII